MITGSWRRTATPWWFLAACIGLAAGTVAALSFELALGIGILLLSLYVFARSGTQSEVIVAVYWLAFAVYSIIFHDVTIQFFFYPFYAAFFAAAVLTLLGEGLRLEPRIIWLYVGFMICVMLSFLGLDKAIDSDVIQRLLGYLVGALVLLQFRSVKGLGVAASGAILSGIVISIYVISNVASLGYESYRGGVGLNPNVVAMVILFGAVTALAWAVDRFGTRGTGWRVTFLLLISGTMLYSMTLLASRGMAIALGTALLVLLLRAILTDWRKLGLLVILAGLGGSTLLLPGSDMIIERFTTDETVTSAGSRTPIWEVTLQTYMASSVPRLVFGHGFDSSEPVVQRYFPTLISTHNSYIQMLYEFGLVGLIVFTALLLYLLWVGWKTPGPLGAVMVGLTVALIMANLSDNAADYYIYWIVMGFVMAIGTWAPKLGR